MKPTVVVALVMLGLSIPAFGQDKTSCKAFFQVVRADTQTPEGLHTGMDGAQQKWWENEGQKEYPGLCLNGSVSTGDKPRYLVILSKSGSIDGAAVAPGEVYGQTARVIQSAAPKEWIYRPRWNMASISVLYVSYDGNLDQPPVHMQAGDRSYGWFRPNSTKVLKVAVKYLSQEPLLGNAAK
ncbi:MAG: hypothetical protein ABSE45_10705 [Candidatus Acidiferrales bacterium]